MKRLTPLVVFVVIAAAVGCASEPSTPAFHWPGTRPALQRINHRTQRIQTLSTQGQLTMIPPNKKHGAVTMETALAVKRPDQFRFQAFKFGQTVFDLLARDGHIWVKADRRIDQDKLNSWFDQAAKIKDAGDDSDQRTMDAGGPWMGPLMQPLPINRIEVLRNDARTGRLVIRWPIRGLRLGKRGGDAAGTEVGKTKWSWLAVIDRSTLTVSEYRLLNDENHLVQRIRLARYRMIDGIAWPTRIHGRGRVQIDLRLNDTHFNTTLPDAAFDHPAGARQLR